MATGTGKTLTSAAVIRLFLRSGNANRVLFLVDRIELENQATDLLKLVMAQEVAQRLGGSLPESIQKDLKPLPWEIERNSLIKKECHKYDEEWRMIANAKMKLPAMIEWVPKGVIIGLRTSQVDKNLIISMAKEAGVKNIYQSYIDEKNRLNAYLLKDV